MAPSVRRNYEHQLSNVTKKKQKMKILLGSITLDARMHAGKDHVYGNGDDFDLNTHGGCVVYVGALWNEKLDDIDVDIIRSPLMRCVAALCSRR